MGGDVGMKTISLTGGLKSMTRGTIWLVDVLEIIFILVIFCENDHKNSKITIGNESNLLIMLLR